MTTNYKSVFVDCSLIIPESKQLDLLTKFTDWCKAFSKKHPENQMHIGYPLYDAYNRAREAAIITQIKDGKKIAVVYLVEPVPEILFFDNTEDVKQDMDLYFESTEPGMCIINLIPKRI